MICIQDLYGGFLHKRIFQYGNLSVFTCCHGSSRCKQNSRFVSSFVLLVFFAFRKESINIVEHDLYSGFVWRFFTHKNFSIWKSVYVYLLPWHLKMQAKFTICIEFCFAFFF
ncbi:hypothetical protein AMTRI_Chr05g68160 [Amborella trichopoda]